VAASGTSPWHIRALEKSKERKLAGGIDTNSLCQRVKAPSGWDVGVEFMDHVNGDHICRTCKDLFIDYHRTGSLYIEHQGRKYIRMRDIDGLEKQLLGRVARITWYVTHQPTPELFLLECGVERRLNTNSERWFKEEEFRLAVPKEKVSAAFVQALRSPPPGARASTGTSSGRRGNASRPKTTSASRR